MEAHINAGRARRWTHEVGPDQEVWMAACDIDRADPARSR
jgi:hypothetical protein